MQSPTASRNPAAGLALAACGLLFLVNSASGQPTAVELGQFLASARLTKTNVPAPDTIPEKARYSLHPNGVVQYVGAPPETAFLHPGGKGLRLDLAAAAFLKQHGRLFGIDSPAVDFAHLKTNVRDNRHYVRLQQTYGGIPVFAAQAAVQLDADGVQCVLSDIQTDFVDFDSRRLSLEPRLSAGQAIDKVLEAEKLQVTPGPAQLAILAPAVFDEPGKPVLAWQFDVSSRNLDGNERLLADANTGRLLRRYPLSHPALNRAVFDATNTVSEPGGVARLEGQPASTVADANDAYEYLGQTWQFYSLNHGRDSIDGSGTNLSATVRRCWADATCPWPNAAWFRGRMYFGAGWATDDVTGHELTHGVTEFESGLIYSQASGAINESFSDIWGEFIDLGNGAGDDSPGARWLVGEDLARGAVRSMQYPTNYNCADRLGSPLYYTGTNDHGGVHWNSGVNNKLCYLLTDGDTFNGQTVYGMGIPTVADLYYEVNVNLLTAAANWTDLYNALTQAAVNLRWGGADRYNLYLACAAVELVAGPASRFVDRSSTCTFASGLKDCFGLLGPYFTLAQGVAGTSANESLWIRTGSYNEPMTITKPLHIRAYDGPVVLGR